MTNRIRTWIYDHPKTVIFSFAAIISILLFSLCFKLANVNRVNQLEKTKTADFVMYTSDGAMLGMEHEVIVDMDTGYQYLVFNINGDYVIAPRISEDGTFYKTIE